MKFEESNVQIYSFEFVLTVFLWVEIMSIAFVAVLEAFSEFDKGFFGLIYYKSHA